MFFLSLEPCFLGCFVFSPLFVPIPGLSPIRTSHQDCIFFTWCLGTGDLVLFICFEWGAPKTCPWPPPPPPPCRALLKANVPTPGPTKPQAGSQLHPFPPTAGPPPIVLHALDYDGEKQVRRAGHLWLARDYPGRSLSVRWRQEKP